MKLMSDEAGLRWMLAAWVLLATSITSSGFVHSHSGGNLCRHDDDSGFSIADSSSPASCRDAHDCNVCPPGANGSTVPYEKSQCRWCVWIDSVSVANGVRISSKQLTVDQSSMGCLADVSTRGLRESERDTTLCACSVMASPLCDRARHERSGVQLA